MIQHFPQVMETKGLIPWCVCCGHCSSATLDSVGYNFTIPFESEWNQWNSKCLKLQCRWKSSWKFKSRSRILYLVTAQSFQPIQFTAFHHRPCTGQLLEVSWRRSHDLLCPLPTSPLACSERPPKLGSSVTFPVFTWSHHLKRFSGLWFSCCNSES